jgi:Fe-S oxidoreductase
MDTPDTVNLFIASLKRYIRTDEYTAMEACLNCRICGSACAWYLATGDETLHPKYKKDFIYRVYKRHIHPVGRFLTAMGIFPPLTEETLRRYMPYFWKCTTCGRCTLACPLGLSNRSVMRLGRTAFCDSGLIAENPVLKEVRDGSRFLRHSFALPSEKLLLRFGLFLANEGTVTPFDVVGADYLYAGSAVENTRFPDFGVKVPKILNAANIRYTFSSLLTDTGTDIEHVVVHRELSKEMLEDVEQEARRLKVRTVLISECGCDIRTFYIKAGTILGRPFKYPVQSFDSLMVQSIRSGMLPVEKAPGRITFHDPCKVVRLAGMGDLQRELLHLVAKTIIEMSPNREYNYCCNGGTGPLRLPENSHLRRRISRIKANQIQATGAERVVTPCAVCMLTLEDICQIYQLTAPGRRMSFMTFELVYEAMERALEKYGQVERTRMPAVLRDQTAEYVFDHSMAVILDRIARRQDSQALMQWLAQDAVTARYTREHPETINILQLLQEQARIARYCEELYEKLSGRIKTETDQA